ncbi:uncharacterized protein LOC4576628 isoform X1 [Anopheles gambiae]|uniref:uncharacterized protein LOC4576628 isoform X1 n=2 Tax=Anopheles gambiae TaxID=7165 RepID=UPI002AC90D45|nr:uncharacterized protein LOC4576628 isoform X1 [Anopheles gambiae]
MGFRTKFVQDLCTTDTEIYEQLLQFALNEHIFLQNVKNLRKPSLEALVYVLLMKQRGKLPDAMLSEEKFSLKTIMSLIQQNHLRLQGDSETSRWILSALALTVLTANDTGAVHSELDTFVKRFDHELHEIPLYYDVLQTFLILAKEDTELMPHCCQLSGEQMVRRLTSESKTIRMKALACLQTLLEFNSNLYGQWLCVLQSPNLMIESKVFLLFQLLETLLRTGGREADIQHTLQQDHVWRLVIEGITTKDAVCRKETLATVQHAIGYAQQCELDLAGQYFNWSQDKSAQLTNAWQSFVTIVEALNESQTHLILPALEMIEKVQPLHVAWSNVLLRLILLHENGRVVNHGLNYFLQHRSFDPTETELEKQFLEAFNRAALLENVQEMITKLSAYYGKREAFAYLVQTLPEIEWKSVQYYCLVRVIHNGAGELAGECKRLDQAATMLRSLTSCAKLCHSIKNVPLRYVTFVLLVKSVNHFSEPTTDPGLLLAVVAEMEKLTPIFSISLQQFQSEAGWTFCDHIADTALMPLLEQVTVADTFFVEQVLASRIVEHGCIKNEQLLDVLIDANFPVCLKVFQLFPKLDHLLRQTISGIVHSTISSLKEGKKTNDPIPHKTFTLLAEMFHLNNAQALSTELESELNLLRLHLEEIVSERLQCFDYAQPSAKETIQLTHLIAAQGDLDRTVYPFFASVSLKELETSFGRYQSEQPPSIDQLYVMIAEIYLHCRQRSPKCSKMFTSEACWSKLINLLDVGNIHVLTVVIDILQTDGEKIGSDWYDDQALLPVVDRCYSEILNYRKSDHFMRLMEKFVRMLFQPYVACRPETIESEEITIACFVTGYVGKLLEQASTIGGLANVVYESMYRLPVELLLDWLGFDKLLLQGIIFGEVPKREQKLESDVIDACGVPLPFKQHSRHHLAQADARVRVLCVLVLYRIASTNHPVAVLFLLKVERMLIERFAQLTKTKERYYADSITHRQKLRIVQALCVVLKLTGTQPYPVLNAMLYETNQPNINYLFELIVADSTIDTLTIWSTLRNEQVKVSGIQSVFVILWLRCCREQALDERYINLLLPWTMAQNFSTRLYAQITIKKLLERFAQHNRGPLRQIYDAVNSYLRQGNVERNIERCMKDFRFGGVLDGHNLLTLANVFHNIPKVSDAPAEDVVGMDVLLECIQAHDGGCGEKNLGQVLEFHTLPAEKRETLFLAQSFGGSDFVQRKIVPLKSLEPNPELLLGLPQHLCAKKMDCTDGLIVVASLVNRAPNLGGLARTGEIFAIKQLVINSLQDIGNKEFQALSMTAEKWLKIGELKTHRVVEYLREMKEKGYSVVGAEQTTGSKPIHQLQFPKKSVLVLGHEKNGLPAEIIRHLDLIGEIPQFGVVRSLNVHVTGAIFMWEYAKQHHVVATDC